MSIEQIKRKPLSDGDILAILGTRVIRYEELKNYSNIDDVLKNNSLVLLINNKAGPIGHWVCLVKRGKVLSYFDSAGRAPDPPEYNIKNPYLSKLLYKSPYELEYSEKRYQKRLTSTCGRHVILRIIMKDRPLSEYQHLMNKFKNKDDFVSAVTYFMGNHV